MIKTKRHLGQMKIQDNKEPAFYDSLILSKIFYSSTTARLFQILRR